MCDCRANIEGRLLERFKEQYPVAKDHRVELKGYTFILGQEIEEKAFMPVEFRADFHLKKGGTKKKVMTENLIFNCCPFCGEKYSKDEPSSMEGGKDHVAG